MSAEFGSAPSANMVSTAPKSLHAAACTSAKFIAPTHASVAANVDGAHARPMPLRSCGDAYFFR